MRPVLLLLAAALLAPCIAADEEMAFVDLPGARVLASPGTPEGLHAFLPGNRPPEALTWPLPDGPLLVLGLPGTDEAARDLAFFWDLLGPGDDLHGGYVVAAWHDGRRPIAVILGDDAAALYAARFELESAPGPVSAAPLDFTKPQAAASLRLRRGQRTVRPRYRIRAFAPDRLNLEAVITAIAGRANRLWIDTRRKRESDDVRILPRLARYGIEPVLVLTADMDDDSDRNERTVRSWTRGGTIRSVVLVPTGFAVGVDDVERHVERLEETFDLSEVVVLDPTLRVRGTLGTWLPAAWGEGEAESAEARRRVDVEGHDLLFVESWARVSRTPVPSLPRGRSVDLGEACEGIVVLDGPGADLVLEDAWEAAERGPAAWEEVLLPLLPRRPLAPRDFLDQTAARLEAMDDASKQVVGWVEPLLGQIRAAARDLPEPVLQVPRMPASVHVDARLDEPAWRFAASMRLRLIRLVGEPEAREVELLAIADGTRLHLALRAPADVRRVVLSLGASAEDHGPAFGGPMGRDFREPGGTERGGALVWRRTADALTWECTLDHFDLGGDAHPTRVLRLFHRPEGQGPKQIGALVLGP